MTSLAVNASNVVVLLQRKKGYQESKNKVSFVNSFRVRIDTVVKVVARIELDSVVASHRFILLVLQTETLPRLREKAQQARSWFVASVPPPAFVRRR